MLTLFFYEYINLDTFLTIYNSFVVLKNYNQMYPIHFKHYLQILGWLCFSTNTFAFPPIHSYFFWYIWDLKNCFIKCIGYTRFIFSIVHSGCIWISILQYSQNRRLGGYFLYEYICLHLQKSKSVILLVCTVIVLVQVPFTFNDITKEGTIVLMTQIQAIQWQFSS